MGWVDVDLNDTGVSQAQELAKKLSGEKIGIIISSPLKRSIQTAEIINQYLKKEIVIDKRLIERGAGAYEGMKEKDVFVKQKGKSWQEIYNEVPLGGESAQEVQKRIFDFLGEIKEKYRDKNILIITHSFVVKMINKYFNPDISLQEFFDFGLGHGEAKKYVIPA